MSQAEYLKTRSGSVFEAMNSRDFNNYDILLDDNAILDFPGAGKIEGKRRIVIFLKALLRNYKQLHFTVHDIITDTNADKSCVVWTNKGEHVSGKPYQNSGNTIIHLRNDKIILMSDYFKDTSFVQAK